MCKLINILLLFFFYSYGYCATVVNKTSSVPLLLLVSFDGFRWDYPDMYQLPNFSRLARRGVRVRYVRNNFATLTFPLHYTIVTGLYEETHGIVANTMFDPQLNSVATIETMNDTRWWSQNPYSQPIWMSNELANDSNPRRSGVIAWPSAGTSINGHLPFRHQTFDLNRTFDSTLEQIFKWFQEPEETRINLGVIYYPEPDITGHKHGPLSNEMKKTLAQCDDYIGLLLKYVDSDAYLKENLNVIITSDHGMEAIEHKQKVKLEDYIDTSLCSIYGTRSSVNIFVNSPLNIDRIYANLSNIPNFNVYKKSEIPDEYHYKSNVRIGDILFVAQLGYEMIPPGDDISLELNGNHGYDSRNESMHAIFYAFGPVFRTNMKAEPFETVDIYPLMSSILKLQERKTNGSLNRVKHILRNNFYKEIFHEIDELVENTTKKVISLGWITIGCVALVLFVSIIYIITAFRHARQLVNPQSLGPVRYRLLSNDEGSKNNFYPGTSDNEEGD